MKLPLAVRRHRLFKFLSSLNLALWLLGVLIVASVAGTLYESSFSAEVAKTYVYGAWWFQVWLALLAINLASVAFSRMPWKRRHLAFLLTHFGIITILIGAMVGKWFGIEGSVTLFEGQLGTSRLVINQEELTLKHLDQNDEVVFPIHVINRQPSNEKPWKLGKLDDIQVQLTGYSKTLQQQFDVKPVTTGGTPAIKVKLQTVTMNQTIEKWLLLGEKEHSSLDLQLAEITLGQTPRSSETTSTEASTSEFIFIYEQKPGEQVSRLESGTASGLQAIFAREGKTLALDITDGQKSWQREFRADELPAEWKLSGTKWMVTFSDYWPDFTVKDGVPLSASDDPNNPAVLLKVTGVAAEEKPLPAAESAGAPAIADVAGQSWLHLYPGENSAGWRYQLQSRQLGASDDQLKVGEEIATGWADWTLTVVEILPQARPDYQFSEAKSGVKGVPGVRVRLSKAAGEATESWVPMGWQIDLPVQQEWVRVLYGRQSQALPFVIRLENFELKRNPGTLDPASFTSYLEISERGRGVTTGFCTMNEPMNYPDALWRSLTGLTYKMSQAGWNPEDLNQSSIQILRDPGWFFKWVGSLTFCVGVACLFYGKSKKPVGSDFISGVEKGVEIESQPTSKKI